ncbi:MAG: PQQ-dependent sugar dehydrogenase [Bacteroidota bacterium]
MKKFIGGLLIACMSSVLSNKTDAQNVTDTIGNTPVVIHTVLDSTFFLNGNPNQFNFGSGPWGLLWGPDQKLWIANKRQINRYDPYTGTYDTVLTIPSGYIMDVATHGSFPNEPYVYASIDTGDYYASSAYTHLYRFTWNPLNQTLNAPLQLLGWSHGGEHSGGRVIFGQDGKLYVSTAEYYAPFDSLFNNSGKILRVNPDGTVPLDNPFQDYTFTRGHRNPQGLVQVPSGTIFSSEHGQMMGNDELNRIDAGGNYGWITFDAYQCIGNMDTCQFYFPYRKFPINNGAHPPSGIDYYGHPAIPEFNGLLMAVTGINQGIYALGLNVAMDSTINKNRYLYAPGANGLPSTSSKFGRIRDVCATPYGSVFFIARDRNYPRVMEIYNPVFSSLNTSTQVDIPMVFPNPCTSGATVFIKQLKSVDLEFEVLDTMGKIIISGIGTNNQLQFDTKGLKSGVYFIRTSDLWSQKLIVIN